MAKRWYVVNTEPGVDHLSSRELARDNFEVFSPRVRDPQSRNDRGDIAVFPGYIFLRVDLEEERPAFKSVHRVRGLVHFGGDVPWLPDDVIEELANQVKTINGQDGLWQKYSAGDTVQVVSGFMEGLGLVVEEAKSPQSKAKVLLEFMGRMVRADVPWHNLRTPGPGSIGAEDWERWRAPRRTRGKKRWIKGYGDRATQNA